MRKPARKKKSQRASFLRCRLEVERLVRPRVSDRLRRRRLQHSRHHVVLRPEVLVAGGVREKHANGYIIPTSETGDIFRDRIVECEFAFLLENESCDGGELLAIEPTVAMLGLALSRGSILDDR